MFEQLQKVFNERRDAANADLRITPNQLTIMGLLENAQQAGTPITYELDDNDLVILAGKQRLIISDDDEKAAALGVLAKK